MIRRAEVKDIDAILDLLLQVLMVHHNGRPDLFKPDCTKYNHDELEEIIKDDLRPIFVYDDAENGVVGYAFCVHQEHPDDNVLTPIKTLYIDDICISENFRRHGVGKSILDYACVNSDYYAQDNYDCCDCGNQNHLLGVLLLRFFTLDHKLNKSAQL